MTLISPEAAILFGGFGTDYDAIDDGYGDCWMLDIVKLLSCEYDTPSSLWKMCGHQGYLTWEMHAAVVEPVSKRLWIFGGFWRGSRGFPTNILSMSFNSLAPLRLLAMESAISHFDRGHQVWKDTEIPRELRTELEHLRAHMKEEDRSGMEEEEEIGISEKDLPPAC